jgi:hypothetical protein
VTEKYMLRTGEILCVGERLCSPEKKYHAELEKHGNFAVMQTEDQRYDDSKPSLVWVSDTGGNPEGDYFVILEKRGSFSIFSGKSPKDSSKELLWSTESSGKGIDYFLRLSDFGELGIFEGEPPVEDKLCIWNAGSLHKSFLLSEEDLLESSSHIDSLSTARYLASPARKYFLYLEKSGNLVLCKGKPDEVLQKGIDEEDIVWASETHFVDKLGMVSTSVQENRNRLFEELVETPCFLKLGSQGDLAVFKGTDYTRWDDCDPSAYGSEHEYLITPLGMDKGYAFDSKSSDFFLKLQDDGKLAIFRGTPLKQFEETWNTTTYFEILNYEVRIRNDWDSVWGGIVCYGEKYALEIYFLREGIVRKNHADWKKKRAVMVLPSELYPRVIDLLRNEKPVYGWCEWANPEKMGLMTGEEPVGEGEIQ